MKGVSLNPRRLRRTSLPAYAIGIRTLADHSTVPTVQPLPACSCPHMYARSVPKTVTLADMEDVSHMSLSPGLGGERW